MSTNPVLYEDPAETVNMSLDDMVGKKQKALRTRPPVEQTFSPEESAERERRDGDTRQYVHNTVAHIQHEARADSVNGPSVMVVLRFILGYLLKNHLLSYRLPFFVDGQKRFTPRYYGHSPGSRILASFWIGITWTTTADDS